MVLYSLFLVFLSRSLTHNACCKCLCMVLWYCIRAPYHTGNVTRRVHFFQVVLAAAQNITTIHSIIFFFIINMYICDQTLFSLATTKRCTKTRRAFFFFYFYSYFINCCWISFACFESIYTYMNSVHCTLVVYGFFGYFFFFVFLPLSLTLSR